MKVFNHWNGFLNILYTHTHTHTHRFSFTFSHVSTILTAMWRVHPSHSDLLLLTCIKLHTWVGLLRTPAYWSISFNWHLPQGVGLVDSLHLKHLLDQLRLRRGSAPPVQLTRAWAGQGTKAGPIEDLSAISAPELAVVRPRFSQGCVASTKLSLSALPSPMGIRPVAHSEGYPPPHTLAASSCTFSLSFTSFTSNHIWRLSPERPEPIQGSWLFLVPCSTKFKKLRII